MEDMEAAQAKDAVLNYLNELNKKNYIKGTQTEKLKKLIEKALDTAWRNGYAEAEFDQAENS
jgi:hypothetical protein